MPSEDTRTPDTTSASVSTTITLTEIIDTVTDTAKAPQVAVRDVIEAVGDRSFAPILLLPALALATPLSGIPLFSSLMGIIIFLISVQMVMGRRHLWLPDWVLRRQVKGTSIARAFGYVRGVAAWLDRRTNTRLRLMVRRPLVLVPQIICAVSGACLPVLEFVPFSSSVLGVGIALLALGMLARDGLVILLGLIPYSGLFYLVWIAVS